MKRKFNAGLTPAGTLAFTLIIVSVILMIVSVYTMANGNIQFFDTTYKFDTAQIRMPDGSVVVGEVDSWLDYDNSDQIQIEMNGATYLTHASNVVLVSK